MRTILGLVALLALAGCPGPVPVTPTPDASDAAPPDPPVGDAGAYAACCAAMHDVRPECPATLEHVVSTHLAVIPAACTACGLACR